MDEVVARSSVIFYGEVIGIEKVGEIVAFGEEQKYRITVFPRETYKGKAKNKYKFEGYDINNNKFYDEKSDPNSEEIIVGGCGLNSEMGDKYVVFIEKGKKIHWSWCSEHVLPADTNKYNYFVNNIKEKL